MKPSENVCNMVEEEKEGGRGRGNLDTQGSIVPSLLQPDGEILSFKFWKKKKKTDAANIKVILWLTDN